jgi:hypothetical protein
MTNMNAFATLVDLAATSKTVNGFSLQGNLQAKISRVLGVHVAQTSPEGIAAEREARGLVEELSAKLASFVAGSPKFFGGQIGAMREQRIDVDLVATLEQVLAAYQRGIVGLAATSSAMAFASAARKCATMVSVLTGARREHTARRERAAAAAAAKAARIAAVHSWTLEPPKAAAPKPVREIRQSAFGGQLAAALAA